MKAKANSKSTKMGSGSGSGNGKGEFVSESPTNGSDFFEKGSGERGTVVVEPVKQKEISE